MNLLKHSFQCCIKSSGTLAAAGYFPSMEDSSQRRMAYQNQVAAAVGNTSVHAVQNTISQPQPQQPQPLIQPFNTMQLHSYLSGSPANIYYQQVRDIIYSFMKTTQKPANIYNQQVKYCYLCFY